MCGLVIILFELLLMMVFIISTLQCELCLCWQHGSCFNVQSNSQLPDFYACQSCSEPEKVRLSRKYEWAESEFYRLGKLPS